MNATTRWNLKPLGLLAIILALGLVSAGLSLADHKGKPHGGGKGGGDDTPPPSPLTFSIAFLPTDHFPLGMNDNGELVGWGPGPVLEFLRLADGTIVYEDDIVPEPAGWNLTRFEDINNFGQIAVSAKRRDGSRITAAYRITPGDIDNPAILEDLGTLGGVSAEARSINDAGDMAGFADDAAGNGRAFLYTDLDSLIDLGTLGGDSSASSAVNELGEVAGTSALPDNSSIHAFRDSAAQPMLDLGALSKGKSRLVFRRSIGEGINDNGDVVGWSNHHAFLYTDQNGIVDLGAFGKDDTSHSFAINNQGLIVGTSTDLSRSNIFPFAFLYLGGTMYHLQDLVVNLPGGCQLIDAVAINEFNEICGRAFFADGTRAGFVLTPVVEP